MLHSGFNFLLCVVAILCINLLCVESFYPSKCVETERQALLKFKDALIHSKVNLTSWKGEECCKWEGISCHNLTGYVTSLNLKPFDYTKAVGGKLDYSICELQHLISLNLDDIGLEGKIPKCIGSLGNLIELKLMYNNFFGVIPPSLGNLSNLQTLDLSHNYLTANDLEWLSHLSDLRYLDLSEVNLTLAIDWLSSISKIHTLSELHLFGCGLHQVTPKSISYMNTSISLKSLDLGENSLNSSILPWVSNVGKVLITLDLSFNQFKGSKPLFEITKLASLQHLDLSHNELSGSFPHTIGQLSYLQELFLSSNKFNSVIIETHLSNLSHLRILDVAHNSLSFNLSLDSVPPFKLFALYASSCTLGPKFPVWLKHHGELRVLDISSSGISDSFPKWFWNLSSSLIYFNVSYNKLNGPLPKSIPNMKFSILENVWDFSFNNLNGSLPPFPKFYALFLSSNMFTESLSSFCTSSSLGLTYLDLSSNLLKGQLSNCWKKFEMLQVLNLAQNQLSGKIPSFFGSLRHLESLHLNNNNFSGEIPPLTLCSSLTLIDVGDNNLQGILPMWIGSHLHRLIVLRLRVNKFQGNIPTSMCNLSFLQVLDLSENNITGKIPQCLGDIIALSNLNSPRKSFHYISYGFGYMDGKLYDVGSFNDKEILALKGSNREYGKNLGLMATIDLSSNHLTGEIPQSITKLVVLVGLNLSRNNLTGFIPSNIGHMESLESLDLSRNHLYGKMPTSFSSLTFLGYMNLSFNNLEGKIPLSTQLQTFDPSSYVGNSRLCGPPLINLCPDDVISPTSSNDKHVTIEEEDKLITFGFYVSLVICFFVGFWGVCGTLVIKTSWRHAYFKFFNNLNDWIHVTLSVFVNRLKKRFQVED